MDKIITTRLPDRYLSDLKEISLVDQVDTSTTIRKLLAKAIAEWKIDYSLDNFKKGVFSFEQAREFSGLNVWDFRDVMHQKKVSLVYTSENLKEDLKKIKWLKQQ